jgi:hypothetical protein
MLIFIWEERNIHHIAEHDVAPAEAEYVVRNEPNPAELPENKFLV